MVWSEVVQVVLWPLSEVGNRVRLMDVRQCSVERPARMLTAVAFRAVLLGPKVTASWHWCIWDLSKGEE